MSLGADLISLEVDRTDFSMREISRVSVEAPIQYVWPHPSRMLLYVASSNRSVSKADDVHLLTTVAVDGCSGAMRVIDQIALPTRPIHLTAEGNGQRLFIVYNAPNLVTSHPIRSDGTVGEATPQSPQPIPGHYPHQIRVTPSGNSAIIVARGSNAHGNAIEQPGSLQVLAIHGNTLVNVQTVAPSAGYGFGPRHLDFHPSGRWVAVSIERQNELHIYSISDDRLSNEPIFRLQTLKRPALSPRDQLAGTLHFHPNGRYLYLVNRNDTSIYGNAEEPSEYEGNNIAVYAFDEKSGKPEALQYVLTESIHVRTFSLDEAGTVLVSASILPAAAVNGACVETIPARLSFFRVAYDGRLTLARTQEISTLRGSLFWSSLNENTNKSP